MRKKHYSIVISKTKPISLAECRAVQARWIKDFPSVVNGTNNIALLDYILPQNYEGEYYVFLDSVYAYNDLIMGFRYEYEV